MSFGLPQSVACVTSQRSSVNLAPQAGRRASRSAVCSWAARRTRAW
ncbi:hypothetical protein ACF1GS_29720 [Streptomyces eurythermus]|nr:hypothetical protein J3S85_25740 [Streptomyces lavenduligriseus]